jgi:hypothetical protein
MYIDEKYIDMNTILQKQKVPKDKQTQIAYENYDPL